MSASDGGAGRLRRIGRATRLLGAALVAISLVWWFVGRLTVDDRRIVVERPGGVPAAPADTVRSIRVLTWNIAHGRGDVGPGLFQNWMGGSAEVRAARLAKIAGVLREARADIVVLNEVDFDSDWSGGLDQAEVLARSAGYPVWFEQRNYDVRLPFWTLSFGNAVLTRLPVEAASPMKIPPHSDLEALLVGAKTASNLRLETSLGRLILVPVHLDVRSGETRLAAFPTLDSLRAHERVPLILAGDFNTSPVGWPGADESTVLEKLLDRGLQSPRARGSPSRSEWTFPTFAPARAIDWILAEPPLRVIEAHVLHDSFGLSDHGAVLSVVTVDRGG